MDNHVPDLEALLAHGGGKPAEREVTFTDPDITYLVRRCALPAQLVIEMLRKYGPRVVKEALRSAIEQRVTRNGLFVAICQRVEIEKFTPQVLNREWN